MKDSDDLLRLLREIHARRITPEAATIEDELLRIVREIHEGKLTVDEAVRQLGEIAESAAAPPDSRADAGTRGPWDLRPDRRNRGS